LNQEETLCKRIQQQRSTWVIWEEWRTTGSDMECYIATL